MTAANRQPPVTVCLELDNAEHGDWRDIEMCLRSLVASLVATSPTLGHPVDLMIAAPDVETGRRAEAICASAAGRDRMSVRLVVLPTARYYDKKSRAALLSESDFMLFADCDCVYEVTWATALLSALRAGAPVVHGRTFARVAGASSQQLSSALVWSFPLDDPADMRRAHQHLVANNFGVRRDLIARVPFPVTAAHRGQGRLWTRALAAEGIESTFVEGAVSFHRQPEGLSDMFRLGWRRGADNEAHLRLDQRRSSWRRGGHGLRSGWRELRELEARRSSVAHPDELTRLVRRRALAYGLAYQAACVSGRVFAPRSRGTSQ